jgi:hypothetical protein
LVVAKWTKVFECVQLAVEFVRRIRPAALLMAAVSGVTGEAVGFLDTLNKSGMCRRAPGWQDGRV